MWAAKDNGSPIDWHGAKSYCENYRGGGYTDWRMPTQNELAELYDRRGYHKDAIKMTTQWIWASETRGSEASYIVLYGKRQTSWNNQTYSGLGRALPVRSGK
jgi:hypothetical protein